MKLTKVQKRFLESLKALNATGVSPNVMQVASTAEGDLSWGQTLYLYKVCNKLIARGLVCDNGVERKHKLQVTENGLRAIGEV